MKTIDFQDFRKRVGDLRGKEYWRSLEELSRTDAFEEFFAQEFPQQALALDHGLDRRSFMKLMGASVALGGLTACNGPAEKIVPYVNQPENLIPGKPLFFASTMTLGGVGTGVLVESHLGRPTKIEGNPDHPSSLGATDAFMQASILNLYDPDRSQVVRHLGEISTWSDFLASVSTILKAEGSHPGAVRILTQTISSPTLGSQIQQVLAKYPAIAWHQWEPVSRDNVREGLRAAFGSYVNAVYHFDKANVIVSLDADFSDSGPGHLRYARDFASRRRVRKGAASMNRLYAVETSASGVGAVADHRFPVAPSQVEEWARAILASLGGGQPPAAVHPAIPPIVKDLQANRGASIVIAGDDQPAVVHQIAMAINTLLGNIGSTITITDPIEVNPVNQLESLRQLVTAMNAGSVKALIILGGNPAFDAPADFGFAHALAKVPFRVHQSLYYDETGMLCHWHIPETHYLEAWSDARGHDGTVSIVQPLIAPLYNGRSPHELVGALLGGMDVNPYDAVRAYWMTKFPANFEQSWRKWLNDGVIANSALPARGGAASTAVPAASPRPQTSGVELQLKHDPTIYDGRYANIAWLQELPKPQTKITWDNVVIVSAKTARDIGYDDRTRDALVNERTTLRANVSYRGRTLVLPVWVVPGHPDNCATITFGYGRERGGKVAQGTGVNAYAFRFSDAMYGGRDVQISLRHGDVYSIACTQEHQSINPSDVGGDRGIIKSTTFPEYQRNPNFAHEGEEEKRESMYPPYAYPNHAWAMVIDTSVCTGCNGCVVACVAENNIPMVGKEEVVREREMHWLRIDRYYRGPVENPEVYHQPVPCMQCEQAPCEPVCPVEATSHSSEGLNDMTYNRCVGTRYCSNNCPYKVRRFNFFHYSDYETPALKPMRNPDVTVRSRGVMEKCTYCVQRVNEARINAEKENRRVRDGEVTTACAQACPTDAIVFGDMNDHTSRVWQLKQEPTNYELLPSLNTRPRTTYLAAIRNPNPEIRG